MKKFTMLAFLFWSAFSVYGQLTLSSGSHLVINSGSVVVANDVTNSGGSVTNNGTLEIQGDLVNNTSGLLASTSGGTVKFHGTAAQKITGDTDAGFYGTVDIDNSNGVALTATATGSDQTINGTLNFTSGNLSLNGFDLMIGTTDPTGAGLSTGYIKTNGSGEVKRNVPADGTTNVLYPVGNSAYNPITLQNSASATADTFGVVAVDNEPANSSTAHMVNRSWTVTENTAGGTDLTVTAQWIGTEELTNFDRTSSAVGLTTDNGTTYTWGATAAASGSGPYTQTTSGFTGVGTFAVGDYTFSGLTLDLKVYLAGAYNTTNHYMDNTLNTSSLIPTTDPYGLGTTVTAVPAGAVDWVEVQLRNSADSTDTLFQFAKFVDTTGQVINEDGTDMLLTGISKTSYYVSVHHRNHLPVMSASTIDFSAATTPTYNFSTGLAQAWANTSVTTNNAMKEVETNVWALWSSDATQDATISYNGAGNDRIAVLNSLSAVPGATLSNVYNNNDVNMDGNVNYNGAGNDRIFILNTLGAVPGNTYSAHIPQ